MHIRVFDYSSPHQDEGKNLFSHFSILFLLIFDFSRLFLGSRSYVPDLNK